MSPIDPQNIVSIKLDRFLVVVKTKYNVGLFPKNGYVFTIRVPENMSVVDILKSPEDSKQLTAKGYAAFELDNFIRINRKPKKSFRIKGRIEMEFSIDINTGVATSTIIKEDFWFEAISYKSKHFTAKLAIWDCEFYYKNNEQIVNLKKTSKYRLPDNSIRIQS